MTAPMSLARSASGPAGGLSINTGAANSLAPPASQPAASGGLFGSGSASATATAPAMASTGGLFGGGQAKPGLFGNAAPATTQAGTGGGLFGAANTQTQTSGATTGGLFGTASTTGHQGGGGGLFGGANTNTQQQTTGGGLFGSTAGAQPQQQQQQPQQAQTGGLFGGQNQQQQQQTPTLGGSTLGGGGLFGQTQQQQQPQQQQQQQGGGLFGSTLGGQQAKDQNTQGGGLFGQAQPAQNQNNQVSAVQINYDNLRPRSRFDDLATPIQDEIALIDKGIQRVITMRDEIGGFMPQHEKDIEQLGRDVKFVEAKFRTVQVALNRDIQTVKSLQDMAKKNIHDAQLAFKAADNLKLPTHYHQTSLFAAAPPPPTPDTSGGGAGSAHAGAQDLLTYFNRVCDDVERYKRRLDDYRGDIERDMPGVENGLYEQIRAFRDRNAAAAALGGGNGVAVQDQLGQILSALRETGNAIVAQAGQIADTRERLSRLQSGIVSSGAYAMGVAA